MNIKENNESKPVDIPTTKSTRVVATSSSDGHTMLSSVVTDDQGQIPRRNSLASNNNYGVSPTYYTHGKAIQTSRQNSEANPICSPVYGDNSRVFFSHNSHCSCKGSGVGCDCAKTCSC